MGTSAHMILHVDGVNKTQYIHYDGHPSRTGESLKRQLAALVHLHGVSKLVELARAVRVVDDDVPPTLAEQQQFESYANTIVSGGKLSEWYVLLREQQGDLAAVLHSGVLLDGHHTEGEYRYLIDFDQPTPTVTQLDG